MKSKVLIIEDNCYKFFTTKQVLESKFNVEIDVVPVQTGQELLDKTKEIDPDLILYRPFGAVSELLEKMKKRNTNRRNTHITLMVAQDFESEFAVRVEEFVKKLPKRKMAKAA